MAKPTEGKTILNEGMWYKEKARVALEGLSAWGGGGGEEEEAEGVVVKSRWTRDRALEQKPRKEKWYMSELDVMKTQKREKICPLEGHCIKTSEKK